MKWSQIIEITLFLKTSNTRFVWCASGDNVIYSLNTEYLLRINPEESPEENIIENFFRKGYMYAILEALGDRGRSFQREVNNRKKKREKLLFKFELIGKWWNRQHEIDLITVNETQRKVIFWEAERICKSLKERAQIVKEYKKL